MFCICGIFGFSLTPFFCCTRGNLLFFGKSLHAGRQLEEKASEKKSLRHCSQQIRPVLACERLKCQYKRPLNAISCSGVCSIYGRSCQAAKTVEGPGFWCISIHRQKMKCRNLKPKGKWQRKENWLHTRMGFAGHSLHKAWGKETSRSCLRREQNSSSRSSCPWWWLSMTSFDHWYNHKVPLVQSMSTWLQLQHQHLPPDFFWWYAVKKQSITS